MSGELAGTPRPALAGPILEATSCFAEVRVADQVSPAPPLTVAPPPCAEAPGRMRIELPSGVRLSVDAFVDAEALERVLAVLAR